MFIPKFLFDIEELILYILKKQYYLAEEKIAEKVEFNPSFILTIIVLENKMN